MFPSPVVPSFRQRTVKEMLSDPRPFSGGDGEEVATITADALADLTPETLETRRTEWIGAAEVLAKRAESGPLDRDGRKAMRSHLENIATVTEVIAERTGDEKMLADIRTARAAASAASEARRSAARPPMYGNDGNGEGAREAQPVTLGEMFVASGAYQGWRSKFTDGGPAEGGGSVESDAALIPGARHMLGLRTATERMREQMGHRALVSAADASAGDLVQPQYLGLLEPGLVRPLTIRDLVTVIPTTSDAIEYVKEASRSSNAAPVPEAAQIADSGDTGATKPEGGLVFQKVTDTVKTIAEWIAVTKRIVADASALKAYIDSYLTYDLALELEDQMVSGDGTGENLEGILNAGIQVLAAPADDNSIFSQLRKAKTQVRKNGRTLAPLAILVSPEDSEYIDLQLVNGEANHFVGQGPYGTGENDPIWRMPRIETEAVGQGEALVGDFRFAMLFDREQTTISVGTVDKDFIRNILRVLAELRAGFGVIRPTAFARVPLYSGGASSA